MDNNLFQAFLNWNSGLLALGVFVITYMIRTIIEAVWPKSKDSKLWTEVFLPLGPVGTGMILGLMAKKFPLPLTISDSIMAKILYGGVIGMFSGLFYARARAMMKILGDKGGDGDRGDDRDREGHDREGHGEQQPPPKA